MIGAGRPGSLDERELTDLAAPVASGGTAEILRCRLGADTLIYKRYKPAVLGHLDTRAVHAAVAWPSRLDPAEREHLFTICAWPRAVVTRHGAVSGVVMDEAPARFRLPSGRAREFDRVVARRSWAERKPGQREYFPIPHKMSRLGGLLRAVLFLHERGVVIGDLQSRNLLTTAPGPDGSGRADVLLLDCDSFTIDGNAPTPPADPLPWKWPFAGTGFTRTTDLYKFALLAVRCFEEDAAVGAVNPVRFADVLRTSEVELMRRLLSEPQPGISAADLATLASGWIASISATSGRAYGHNDTQLRYAWHQEPITIAQIVGGGPATVPPTPTSTPWSTPALTRSRPAIPPSGSEFPPAG